MDLKWLNRIGILLNFLAGFMIAPELIGIKRLSDAELSIEKSLLSVKEKSDEIYDALACIPKNIVEVLKDIARPNSDSRLAGITGILLVLGIAICSIWLPYFYVILFCLLLMVCLWVLFYFWNYWFAARGGHDPYPPGVASHAFANLLSLLWLLAELPLLSIALILAVAVSLPLRVGLVFLRSVIRYMIRRLEGKQRLRHLVVWWGIVFFILANLIQLVATF